MDDSEEVRQLKITQMVNMVISSLLTLQFIRLNPEGKNDTNKRVQKKAYNTRTRIKKFKI